MSEQDERQERVKLWWKEFTGTPSYSSLTELQRTHAAHIVLTFAEFMRDHEGEGPSEWTSKAVATVCLDTMPKKVVAREDYFVAVAPVLTRFFEFLAERRYQTRARRLAEDVATLGAAIVKVANDPGNWGIAKHLILTAEEHGVDTHDADQLQAFANQMLEGLGDGSS